MWEDEGWMRGGPSEVVTSTLGDELEGKGEQGCKKWEVRLLSGRRQERGSKNHCASKELAVMPPKVS